MVEERKKERKKERKNPFKIPSGLIACQETKTSYDVQDSCMRKLERQGNHAIGIHLLPKKMNLMKEKGVCTCSYEK